MRALVALALLSSACTADKPGDSGDLPGDTDLDTGTDTGTDADADGDGYDADVDCDDTDPAVHPGAAEACNDIDDDCDGDTDEDGAAGEGTWYADADGDGHGDLASAVVACDAPAGHVATADDCDDTAPAIHPGADESDCTDPVDYNCDGSTGYADADADGWAACAECDDTSAAVHPDAEETCNEVDDDCDTLVDEAGSTGETTWYADADGDGFGDPATPTGACGAPAGFVADATDCDDTDAALNPDTVWHRDVDGDGHGGTLTTVVQCEAPDGYVLSEDDCDDFDAAVSPSAAEVCDAANVDEDCDTVADDADASVSAATTATFYRDADRDGWGGTTTLHLCDAPTGYVATAGDCDDATATVNPGATEICDAAGTDEDCDGAVDDADTSVSVATKGTFYRDADGDAYGSASRTTSACDAPAGYVADARDCDDAAATVNPGATEVCDAADRDEDCDGLADDDDASVSAATRSTFYQDGDHDTFGAASVSVSQCDAPAGYVTTAGDCDDTSPTIKPGGAEICDVGNLDEDCDGLAEDADPSVAATGKATFYADTDGDGYGDAGFSSARCDAGAGWVMDTADCDDTRAAVNPAATETCATAWDDDCDGVTNERSAAACTTFHVDADDDTYGGAATQCWCAATGDYTATAATDCDDTDAAVKPGAAERCDGVDNDCDALTDDVDPDVVATTWYADADEDGYGDPDAPLATCELPDGYVEDDTDCDDADPDVNPGTSELYGDAIDDDCDGATTPGDYDTCSGYQVPGDYGTLSAAISALKNSTATICVGAGTHSGTFTFDGSGTVTVQGRGRGVTTLSGSPEIKGNGGTFTLQGASVNGQINVSEYFTGARQHVYFYDLEVDSTESGIRINRNRVGYTWVWMDGMDIDAGSTSSSWAGVEIDDSNTTEWGRDFQVVMYNTYVHDAYYCVFADIRGTHASSLYLEDSTLVGCTTGVRMYSPYDAESVLYVNNTVLYGNTTAFDDGTDGTGWIYGRYNALYGNTTNYAGAASAGEGYLTSDPLLDFSYSPPRPMEGSPLIDAGHPWLGPALDYWGTARGTPDIGAVEH